jgi:hypothetical protein
MLGLTLRFFSRETIALRSLAREREKLYKNKVPPAARLFKGSIAAMVMSSVAFL